MIVAGSGGPSVVLDAVVEFLESGTGSKTQIHGDVALPGLSIRLLAGTVLAHAVADLTYVSLHSSFNWVVT